MREACQMVSYEIPLGISIIIGVMAAGTLNMVQLGHMQSGGIHTWLIYKNPFVFLSFFCYFIASLASKKRAPFDLPESESELVAGFHTEYSGLRFAMFFFAEYAAMFVVGGIQTALFLGGWNDPFGLMGYYFAGFTRSHNDAGLIVLNLIGLGIFTSKALAIVFVQMWLRWTLPRPRIDQVLYACVKVLLPLACVLLLGAALWQLLVPDRQFVVASTTTPDPSLFNPWLYYNPWNFAGWFRENAGAQIITQLLLTLIGLTLSGMVIGWVMYAAATGRNLKQRLTDPAPLMRVPDNLVKA
jgi:NADH-quinone oxidoreductase subunit H